jgi:hypothetical protein
MPGSFSVRRDVQHLGLAADLAKQPNLPLCSAPAGIGRLTYRDQRNPKQDVRSQAKVSYGGAP